MNLSRNNYSQWSQFLVSEQLAGKRQRLGLSFLEIAYHSGLVWQTVRRILSGKVTGRTTDNRRLKLIARAVVNICRERDKALFGRAFD